MARPHKEGLDYAGWATDLFDNEPKIDRLLDGQGATGFFIFFWLCQHAYGSHGYYYPWKPSDAATTARKMGGVVTAEEICSTVELCLDCGLFDRDAFQSHGVITGRCIQKRYAVGAASRRNKRVEPSLWRLSEEECPGFLPVRSEDAPDSERGSQAQNPGLQLHNPGLQVDNPGLQPHNPGYAAQREKERKVKERDAEQSSPGGDAPASREALVARWGAALADKYLAKAGKYRRTGQEAVRCAAQWLREDEEAGLLHPARPRDACEPDGVVQTFDRLVEGYIPKPP